MEWEIVWLPSPKILRNILVKSLIRCEVTEKCKFMFVERRYEGFERTIQGGNALELTEKRNVLLGHFDPIQNMEIQIVFVKVHLCE